jgi:hypothetical protein
MSKARTKKLPPAPVAPLVLTLVEPRPAKRRVASNAEALAIITPFLEELRKS